MDFMYLSNTPDGRGDIFYGPTTITQNSDYQLELITIFRFHQDQTFADLSPGNVVLGAPNSYRTFAQLSEINCSDKKMRSLKFDYYDSDGNLKYLFAPQPVNSNDVIDNSPFGLMLRLVCGASALSVEQVHGTYEGTNSTTYEKGGEESSECRLL
jgi:hypothetical protein